MAQHCKNPAIQNWLMGSFYNADHGTLKSKQSLEARKLVNQARYPTNPVIQSCIIHMMLGLKFGWEIEKCKWSERETWKGKKSQKKKMF